MLTDERQAGRGATSPINPRSARPPPFSASQRMHPESLKRRPEQWSLYDIYLLLTVGRTDHSGAFTEGAGLDNRQALFVLNCCGVLR